MNQKIKYVIAGVGIFLFIVVGVITFTMLKKGNSSLSNSGQSASTISAKYTVDTSTGESLTSTTIKEAGVYQLSGDYSCISINVSGDVQLNLENANISCSNGPGIYVEDADSVIITLTGENTISATTSEDLDGAIYSTDDLVFSGEGSLKVTSNYDGIVSKDTLVIQSGTFDVEADDDAIRGKDSIAIVDGVFNIKAGGDAIKATNEEESGMGTIAIDGGSFNIQAGDDGIHAIESLDIQNGTFNIQAAEGLEATIIRINGGDITIQASDDGINAAQKSNYKSPLVEINGGNITITMGQGDTDGIDSNGDLTITGGVIQVNAQSAFDYDGKLSFTGGEVYINGQKTTTISNQMMGGGMRGGRMR